MLSQGTKAPDFALQDADGNVVSLLLISIIFRLYYYLIRNL